MSKCFDGLSVGNGIHRVLDVAGGAASASVTGVVDLAAMAGKDVYVVGVTYLVMGASGLMLSW